jgi:hypothetical protein
MAKAKAKKKGTHIGFKRLSNQLKRKGVRNPDAVAASIGRKKYGKAGMAKKSAAGRRKAARRK